MHYPTGAFVRSVTETSIIRSAGRLTLKRMDHDVNDGLSVTGRSEQP